MPHEEKRIPVQINLYATLTRYEPQEKAAYLISPGTRVGDLLNLLGVPEETSKLIFVNGRKVEKDTILSAGDRIGVFPPVGGG